MTDKISIACPECNKNYSVSTKYGGRRLKCKACGFQFRLPDTINRGGSTTPLNRSSSPQQPVNPPIGIALEDMFLPSILPNDGTNTPSNLQNYGTVPTHSNPNMIPAIIGSILASFLIIVCSFFINSMIADALR